MSLSLVLLIPASISNSLIHQGHSGPGHWNSSRHASISRASAAGFQCFHHRCVCVSRLELIACLRWPQQTNLFQVENWPTPSGSQIHTSWCCRSQRKLQKLESSKLLDSCFPYFRLQQDLKTNSAKKELLQSGDLRALKTFKPLRLLILDRSKVGMRQGAHRTGCDWFGSNRDLWMGIKTGQLTRFSRKKTSKRTPKWPKTNWWLADQSIIKSCDVDGSNENMPKQFEYRIQSIHNKHYIQNVPGKSLPKVHPSPFSPACLSVSEARLKRSNGIKVKASTMNLIQGRASHRRDFASIFRPKKPRGCGVFSLCSQDIDVRAIITWCMLATFDITW